MEVLYPLKSTKKRIKTGGLILSPRNCGIDSPIFGHLGSCFVLRWAVRLGLRWFSGLETEESDSMGQATSLCSELPRLRRHRGGEVGPDVI